MEGAVEGDHVFPARRVPRELEAALDRFGADIEPGLDAILRKAHALCGIASGSLEIYDGERVCLARGRLLG